SQLLALDVGLSDAFA
ncbi:hypothetical protein DLR58_19205, partial [Vibrio tarriae]